ncbi:phosphoesterase, MJ0936 family [Amycolatopsis xylanica]|uniref:Phosphoesterase, MJ0936 family n=1 Tax=Amycolatopsis xylanica TaxID=589385 RepID=A0A1H3J6U7_9PSEU|nr:metallophosphoesterase family protein [Amycolatopsis xylanica]SDY34914.1 phosphoesterase, MJ0936 family [Amycolatopsis xylanica]
MLNQVAVLADIHGVLPALDAVLAEPDLQAADLIVLCGDVAAGPLQGPTLDRLAGLGSRALWVRGNADREMVALARGEEITVPDPIATWAAGMVDIAQVALLDALPTSMTLDIAGFGEVLFCHATPRDDEEIVLVDSALGRWNEVLDGVSAETVVCGHTHMPFARLANQQLIVNPGSVGMPYGSSGAHWALLGEHGVQLRRTKFDAEAACAAITKTSGYPDIEEWVDFFVRSQASDVTALAAFKPRAG